MTPAHDDFTEPELTAYFDSGTTRNRMLMCIHCTGATHETRRCCTYCGHEVNTVREKCLCGACLREPIERG